MNLALDNLQRLICHKTQTNKQTNKQISKYFGFPYLIFHHFLKNEYSKF